jgi:aminoglycoside 6'-N-acetyltransferase
VELRGDAVVLRPLAVGDVPRLAEIGRQPEVARWWNGITEEELTDKAEGRDDVTALAVRERGHHRLTIDPAVTNTRAVRADEKAGFRPVGVMREHWTDEHGVRHDGLLMDMPASDLPRGQTP